MSARIAALLSERAFSFTPNEYLAIHRKLFTGIYSYAGRIRDYNITKKEWVLDGATGYLELFLRNLLLNEHHPLHNRTLHINRVLKAPGKVNIDNQKANIGAEKVNIEGMFTPKTATHVCELMEAFGSQIVFGRSDVQRVLGLKPTRSSALLHEMTERGVIEPVSGQGKGKYRFRK